MLQFFFVSLVIVFIQNVRCSPSTIRQTLNGPIEGIELMSSLGQKYLAFKGVRYAMPPITVVHPITGDRVDRRFKVFDCVKYRFDWNSITFLFTFFQAPEPIKLNWTEPQKTQYYGHACVPTKLIDLTDYFAARYSEDCLFLNVYVPGMVLIAQYGSISN